MLNSLFFMKRLSQWPVNGLSEVTLRVWAGLEFCSLIVAGMGLGFIFGLMIKKILYCISVWAFSPLSSLFSFSLQFIIIISIIKVFLCQPRRCLTFTPPILSPSHGMGVSGWVVLRCQLGFSHWPSCCFCLLWDLGFQCARAITAL